MSLPPLLTVLLGAELRRHLGRTVIGMLAIAVGVAMGYAVQLINQAALTEFAHTVRTLQGEADVEIRGPKGGFDEALYPRIAALPQVTAVSPLVEANVWLPQQKQVLKLYGIDVFRAAKVTPGLIGRPTDVQGDRLALLAADALFLSPAALHDFRLKPGDRLPIQIGLSTVTLRVAGVLPALGNDGQTGGLKLGVLDIGAAQWRLARLGTLQRLDIKLQPGVSTAAFIQTVTPLLPAGVIAATPQQNVHGSVMLSRAYRVNLNVLALVALFTGAFLVFSAQALAVLRRRSQLALLRALGMRRVEVLRLVLLEGAVQGTCGALAGLALGYALAATVLRYGGADLGGGYFEGLRPTLSFDPVGALLFFALGLAAALAGTWAPAREAASAAPAPALKAGAEEGALQRLRPPWPGLALLVLGLALTRAGPVNGLPLFAYIAIALLLIGAILLMPQLTHLVFRLLPAASSPPLELARAQLAGAPGRAAIGLAGVVASFSLMAAMAIMVTSFRHSVENWLAAVLPAPLYLHAAPKGDSGFLSPEQQRIIATTPGLDHVEFLRVSELLLGHDRPPVALLARELDPRQPAGRLPLVGQPRLPQPGEPPPVWVSEAMVDLYGFHPGQRIALPMGGRLQPFVVAGVWRDYVRQFGAVVITRADYSRLSGDARVTDAALWPAPGQGIADLEQRVRTRVGKVGSLEFARPGEIVGASLKIFDRSFAVTYLLEAVAVLVGVFGVGVSFSAQALARRREFGVLRHLGMTRRQIGAMLAFEGLLLTLLGLGAGLLLGWANALILIDVVNPQSFHWTMQLTMPWRLLTSLAAALLAASTLTALFSARRAMSGQVVQAVREDW
jgi:putative ABC transport system permease protein